MKYYTFSASGTVEVRQDSATELPSNGFPLTDAEYDSLLRGETVVKDGVIMPYVAPVPTAAELAAVVQRQSIDTAIAADATIAQLKAMTNTEFDAWWAANVTTAAQAIQVLKRLAKLAIRRLL